MTMKEAIVEELRYCPGIRMREMEALRNVTLSEKIKILAEMEKEGLIRKQPYSDSANMEFYNKWFAR